MSGGSFALAHELSLRNEAKRAEVERLREELQQLQLGLALLQLLRCHN